MRCGGHTCPPGTCDHDGQLKLDRWGTGPAPAYVDAGSLPVLRSAGQPLGREDQLEFGSRLGFDFSGVRIHADTQAAESARRLAARAFTVGSHVVFGSGQYQPATSSGRAVLAHELTHVVQQSGTKAPTGSLAVDSDRGAERAAEATAQAMSAPTSMHTPVQTPSTSRGVARLMRAPDDSTATLTDPKTSETARTPEPAVGAPTEATVGSETGATPPAPESPPGEAVPMQAGGGTPPPATPVCVPGTALTWANFKGTPNNPKFGALTSTTVVPVTVGATTTFQAKLSESASWVRPKFKNPTNGALTGCNSLVSQCETFFTKNKAGGSFSMTPDPNPTCAASPQPDPSIEATSKAECKTVLGKECETLATTESTRLLAHEQLHMDISCEIATKANTALAGGTKLADVRSVVDSKLGPAQKEYDTDSDHGCDATGQSNWVSEVGKHLPKVTIP
jgi:hypothetical protein